MQLRGPFAEAHCNLGAALIGALRLQGKPGEAVVAAREAIRQSAKDHRFHRTLGAALLEWGKPGQALEAARVAMSLKPDDSGHIATWASS